MKLTSKQKEMLTRAANTASGGVQAYGSSQWQTVERLKKNGLVDENNVITAEGRAAVAPKSNLVQQPEQPATAQA